MIKKKKNIVKQEKCQVSKAIIITCRKHQWVLMKFENKVNMYFLTYIKGF